jgi:acyl carrier protein
MDGALERMQPVFRRVLRQPDLVLRRDLSAQDVKSWDSLAHINLVVALEREFNIRLKTKDLAGLKNVGEMADLIESKLPN